MNKYRLDVSVWAEGIINERLDIHIEADSEDEAISKFIKSNQEYWIKLHKITKLQRVEDIVFQKNTRTTPLLYLLEMFTKVLPRPEDPVVAEINIIKEGTKSKDNKPKPNQDSVYTCPECGSALINRGGCVICSNPSCIYEGCGI